ncbi:MAG TPA: glycosyltransferase, partial [Gammaproteobacteria bacterium]|nr:glycosyltransferase [Gammaproteobacteria bacterium]
MAIPRIIHQLWKTDAVPARWRDASASVRKYHKGWEYRLWTDATMDRHVRVNHPDFYPAFTALNRHIMRVDVFRYVLMNDFGGLYCDLDYEFLRPFNYDGADLWLSLEYDEAYGDEVNQIANYVFASVPGH